MSSTQTGKDKTFFNMEQIHNSLLTGPYDYTLLLNEVWGGIFLDAKANVFQRSEHIIL